MTGSALMTSDDPLHAPVWGLRIPFFQLLSSALVKSVFFLDTSQVLQSPWCPQLVNYQCGKGAFRAV